MPSKGTAGRSAIEPSASAQPDSGKALRDQLRVTDDASRARGRALHGLFERIEWLDQAALVDEEMLADLGTRNPRRDRAWAVEIVRMFRAALEQPTVCAALSRPRENGERIRLWRERPYVITRCGAIESGVIDRLIAWRSDDAGGWSRAHIIDFKTDEISSELAPARAEHYRAQLDAYREAVARMLRVDLQAIRRTLLFVSAGALIDLD